MANWDDLARQAGDMTDEQLKEKISSLTRLKDNDILNLINETGINKGDLVKALQVVKDATLSNDQKAKAISDITKGVDLIIGLVGKFI